MNFRKLRNLMRGTYNLCIYSTFIEAEGTLSPITS